MKGVIKLLVGTLFTKKGKPIKYLRDAWREEAKCGCGIDCCYAALVLRDQSTGESVYIYVEDGEVKTTTDPKADLTKVTDSSAKSSSSKTESKSKQ